MAAIKETLVLTQPFAAAPDSGPIKFDLSGMSDADLAVMIQDLRDPGKLVSEEALEVASSEERRTVESAVKLVQAMEARAQAELPAFQPGVDRWPRRGG